ncbi:hypothetical protein ACU4GD_34530 [Cupriavidus basilensis]
MMALLVLFTATQCILAALMMALRQSAAGRAWGAGQVFACAAGLLVIDARGGPPGSCCWRRSLAWPPSC